MDLNTIRLRGGEDNNAETREKISNKEWFTIAVLLYANLVNYMDRYTVAGVLTEIQNYFQIGDDAGGLLQTVFIVSYMLCAPIFGYLGDRYSRRWLMAFGVLIWGSATLLGSFAKSFEELIFYRGLAGIGETSFSTIAPTIISDLFIHKLRSKILAVFYFAIPIGSGLGYVVGSKAVYAGGSWNWALRVTPSLDYIAAILILLTIEPVRGRSEGSSNLKPTAYSKDIKYLMRNPSFMLSTIGFTCMSFTAGALSWWGPKILFLGIRMQPGEEYIELSEISYKFGVLAMLAGLIGVLLGSVLSHRLRSIIPQCDPLICAFGLFASVPLIYFCLKLIPTNKILCFVCVFMAQVVVNVSWPILPDILLYVVIPTRRSTAFAIQIFVMHAFGDACSPYLIGLISEILKERYKGNEEISNLVKFNALQGALFLTIAIEILGGIFMLLNAIFVIDDREKATRAVKDSQQNEIN